MALFHRFPPNNMTLRARWYLTIGAIRHALIGTFAIGFSDQWANKVFVPIISYAPLWVWGSVFLLTTFVMLMGCFLRSAFWSRAGLILSATSTLAVGVGILLGILVAWQHGQQVTPILPILLLSLAAKDYAVCTQPLLSPFEQLLKRMPYRDDDSDDHPMTRAEIAAAWPQRPTSEER